LKVKIVLLAVMQQVLFEHLNPSNSPNKSEKLVLMF
jgi:hypothetical protein